MKHTQGKWMIAKTGKHENGAPRLQIISDMPYQDGYGRDLGEPGQTVEIEICDLIPSLGISEQEANAKLISSAPSLLDNLKTLERMLSNTVRFLSDEYRDQFAKPLEDSRQAIKEATE